ncbi:zinc finger and BTB domain-containing protein 45-like isoform X3 [Chelonus insularis]|uniref:zinc finger and BTB domain-containing protein 45-like isoform X3 n=1 Tax=Chelonus insularis TaxID=460826 RepID=UPI00158E85C0|nr:zinc finger and BTB domain-containing protein 45-like isoform X3 [Chelonus insularis]
MGSSGQLYSLSWGEFGTSLASAVQLLRGHGDLVDVTLAAGGRSFPAHKIVLSAASPFLLDLLKSTPCQHPVVMLAGISSDDLESLLEFVYRGEVSVEPSQLPSLLQAAHCLSIHGLTPPTILTENGEEVPVSAIPTNTEPVTREIMNSCIPIHRRKKRRKSSSSCSKWPKMDNTTDSEDRHDGHGEDDRTTDYDQKNDDGGHDDAGEQSEHSNHRGPNDWPNSMPQPASSLVITEVPSLTQDHLTETKPSLHTLMAMQQQYSPLHIPSFPGSLNIGLPPGYPLIQAPTSTSSTLKVRGASDCPGICPLCGATLRQARNLRRHLLSSCKYRLNSFHTPQQPPDQMIVEIKPEIEIGAFSGQNHGTDSKDNSNTEQIVCHPSPLPSPTHSSNVVNSHQSISETIAR